MFANVQCIAPALPVVEYYKHEFANGFYEQDEYRGVPTREKDAAWLALWSSIST